MRFGTTVRMLSDACWIMGLHLGRFTAAENEGNKDIIDILKKPGGTRDTMDKESYNPKH